MNDLNGTNRSQGIPVNSVPKHVAIIMDGNGRWATSRGLPRVEGHRRGAATVRMVVEEARKMGIRYLTLFAFSTENWNRPKTEVSTLMKLFARHLESELKLLRENNIRLRAVGNREKLPESVRERLEMVERETLNCDGMDLVLAVSYGGREEITAAVRKICAAVKNGQLKIEQVSEETIAQHLYAPDLPEPELLIRTSGEYRISNFLLWQLAYTEIVVTPVLWPDFSRSDFASCIKEFGSRLRRFGLTSEQIKESRTNV
ncbi:MAG: isoprenyl transferase [Candidatus Dadabacteria bacterium]|nr:MAG: isoprenyl transferase [Candidatus Dadabacteria bacterium]